MSALTLIPEEKIRMRTNYSSKSMESLYSSSSPKLSATYYRSTTKPTRKPMHLTTAPPVISEIRQRVKSARLLRVKHLQNELNDAQLHVTELSNENRLLRTLHKRQDSALSRYENSNAELPQLLHSHAEELRVWQTKYRTLHQQNCALANKLKQKETMLLAMTDQNKHLTQLNKDKNLEDREKLAERLRDLDIRCMEKDEEIKLLVRRLQLESKNFKTQLSAEHLKYKELNNKYEKLSIKCNQSNNGSTILDFHRLNTKIPSSPFSRSPIKMNYRSRKSITNRLNGNNNLGGGGGGGFGADNLQIPSIILNNSNENTEHQQEQLQNIKKSPDIADNSEHLNVSIRKLSPTTFTKYNQHNHYSQYQHKLLLPTTEKFSKNSTDATSSSITPTTTFSTATKDNNDAKLNDKTELIYSVQNGIINLRETKKSINNTNYYSVKSNKLNELEEETDDYDDDDNHDYDDDDDDNDKDDEEENENEFDLNLNDSKNKYNEEDEDDDDENNDDAENDDNDIEEENDQLDENNEENEKISKKQIDRTYQTPRYYNNSQLKYQELIKQNDNIDNNLYHNENEDEDDNFDDDVDNDNKDNVIDQNNNNDDFRNLQLEMQNELLKNEATLDEYCDDTINETSKTLYSTQSKVKPQQAAALHRNFDLDSKNKTIPVSFADNKRQIIDPKKKIRLLEALKAIDSKNSKNNSSS